MNLGDHVKATAGAGREVHKFLDQFFAQFGIDHRVVLHHKVGMKIVAARFGPDAIIIAEQHIRDDWAGQLPEGPDDKSFYREAWAADLTIFRAAYKKAKELESEC